MIELSVKTLMGTNYDKLRKQVEKEDSLEIKPLPEFCQSEFLLLRSRNGRKLYFLVSEKTGKIETVTEIRSEAVDEEKENKNIRKILFSKTLEKNGKE